MSQLLSFISGRKGWRIHLCVLEGKLASVPTAANRMAEKRRGQRDVGTRLQERAVVTPEECASFSLGMDGTIKWLARNKAGLLLCTVYKEEESLF